jgi:hypothetical protein
MTSSRIFATVKVLKTAEGPILRLTYTDGKMLNFALYTGWQGIMIGTSVFDVQLTNYGIRIKRCSGPIRFFHESLVW